MRNRNKKRERMVLLKIMRENHSLKNDIKILKEFIQSSPIHNFKDAKLKNIQKISAILEKYPDLA